tara:strand:+ start:490 stop:732 length:243 start_codon:yes stop_codon:yes gene_type:complete
MTDVYFELQIPNSKTSYEMRKNFLECSLGSDIYIQEDINPFKGKTILSIYKDGRKLRTDTNQIKRILSAMNSLKKKRKIY